MLWLVLVWTQGLFIFGLEVYLLLALTDYITDILIHLVQVWVLSSSSCNPFYTSTEKLPSMTKVVFPYQSSWKKKNRQELNCGPPSCSESTLFIRLRQPTLKDLCNTLSTSHSIPYNNIYIIALFLALILVFGTQPKWNI